MRASDADRDAVVSLLRTHCAAGRLTVDELEQRVAAALSARTLAELDALMADLPGGRPTPKAEAAKPVASAQPGTFGSRSFHQRHELHVNRRQAFRDTVEHIVPRLTRGGWDVVGRSEPELLVFELVSRPVWVPVVCILLFPLGLLALMARETQRVVVTFDKLDANRTLVSVQGQARREVQRAFMQRFLN